MKRICGYMSMCLMVAIFFLVPFSPSVFGGEEGQENASDLDMGKRIYSISCILCHGSEGMGDGPASVFIGPYSHPRPNDFTRGVFKYRTTESGDLPTLSDLMRTIRYGIPGYMPSFKHLGEAEVRQVALYVANTFIEDELPLESAELPEPPPVEPVVVAGLSSEEDLFDEEMSRTSGTEPLLSFSGKAAKRLSDLSRNAAGVTQLGYRSQESANNYRELVDILKQMDRNVEINKEQLDQLTQIKATPLQSQLSAERGKAIFHEMQCIACHGVNGKGHEQKTNMKDEQGLPIMAADLTQPSSFGNGNTRNDIFRTIMTGLNGTPMPSFSDLFIGEEDRAWDLVEYVHSLQEDALARFLP